MATPHSRNSSKPKLAFSDSALIKIRTPPEFLSKRDSKRESKRERESQRERERESQRENPRENQREIQREIQRERERERKSEERERESHKLTFHHVNYLISPFLRLSGKKTKKSCALNRRGTHSLTYSCKAMLVASRRIPLASNYLLYNSTEELRAWLCNHGHAPFKELKQAQAHLLQLSFDQDTYAPLILFKDTFKERFKERERERESQTERERESQTENPGENQRVIQKEIQREIQRESQRENPRENQRENQREIQRETEREPEREREERERERVIN